MRKFITELRRRNVVKVGTVYVVVAWALMQGADVMFPALNLPQWTVTLVAALVIVGFPVALVLAWAYIAVLLRAGRRSRSRVRVPARVDCFEVVGGERSGARSDPGGSAV